MASAVKRLLQIYFDRWQIEVNHRDEKDTLGVGQAQLWNEIAVPKQPVLSVAAYSALLLASLEAFGAERGSAYAALPKWRRRARRPSCLDLITLLRREMAEHPELVHKFDCPISDRGLTAAVVWPCDPPLAKSSCNAAIAHNIALTAGRTCELFRSAAR